MVVLVVLVVLQANKKLQQTIDELTAKVNALKEDNVKLYEKIRYLQDFREERLAKVRQRGVTRVGRRRDGTRRAAGWD